ncbi:GlxA family transcriptional regulator [Kineococcus sp. SYSU DK006]|uniref:GlxA family transcriptional regulator n=1 Tax=Kineococcus sp. SYSU DK006 TaxID=3383127 RepID=UPI003D7E7596
MRIAVYAFDDITMFHLAAPLMVFGELGRLGLAEDWTCRLWSDRPGAVRSAEGYSIGEVEGPEVLRWADMVVIPSWPQPVRPSSEVFRADLRQAHGRGAVVAGLCLGAFAVADAGLLDGRAAVTHWQMLPALAERLPGTATDTSVLYIDHDDVLTSAGTASSIDACLHLVRKHLGSATAARVARSLVVAPHREGGQAQYVERPLAQPATSTAITDVQQWALARLHEDLGVDRLAGRARMSRRTFIRRFGQATGTTPARWVLEQRMAEARVLLESTDWTIEAVAAACGFASPVTFRQNFSTAFATTPTAYRRRFSPLHEGAGRG